MSSVQREWFDKDYYAVLGVAPDATTKDITRAYRQLARDNHPDANPGDTTAEERFKEVAIAYDVVGDEVKRREYDEVRSAVKTGSFTGASFSGFNAGFDDTDLGDLLGGLFGASFGRGQQRGSDTAAQVTIDFASSLRGEQISLVVNETVVCDGCGGTGTADSGGPTPCVACGGSGSSATQKGFFSFASPCRQCGGQGTVIVNPCERCSGSGVLTRDKEVKVRIPQGVEDGQQIRLRGMGERGRFGGAAGDLYVTVNVTADPRFFRSGADIVVRTPVTFPDAALGTTLSVPLPLGGEVKVRVPAGSSSGTKLRVKGKGVKTQSVEGDLLVELDVVVPKDLSDETRELIERLRETLAGET